MILYILAFLFVLSVLVAVHEFGHFAAAKACGIYVDRFSIGMPPRIAGFKWGETDYCIGALPIGGFVKMAGQEDAPLSEDERQQTYGHVPPERWYNNKPIWQRLIVLVAGPGMNIVLAVVVYALLAAIGQQVPEAQVEARVGLVDEAYPAASAPLYPIAADAIAADATDWDGQPVDVGWKTGDYIVAVDGHPVSNFIDIQLASVVGGAGNERIITIERPSVDGTVQRFASPIAPSQVEDERSPRFGIAPFGTPVIREVSEDMPASGRLEGGDEIVAANGTIVDVSGFVALTEETKPGEPIVVTVLRDGERATIEVAPDTIGRIRGLVVGPGPRGPQVLGTSSEVRDRTGVRPRDVIAAVRLEGGEPIVLSGDPEEAAGAINDLIRANPGAKVEFGIERPAVFFGLLDGADAFNVSVEVDSVRAMGISLTQKMVIAQVPPSQWLSEGLRQCGLAVVRTVTILGGLFALQVSPQELGGPLMIAQTAAMAAEVGFLRLLDLMAFISVNLAIFNLLPLPVLDGGQVILNLIEGVIRRPIPPKFVERFQAVGIMLILGLMVFVTYNDIGRLIDSAVP